MSEVKTTVNIPLLEEFLRAGAHFGHKTSRWNPKMKPFIYTERDGVHIIDLVKTMKLLKEAVGAIERVADEGSILIVGTKGQAATMVKKVAEEQGAFYINNRWPGGLFTNHKMIIRSVSKLLKMEEELANGAENLVKKEQLMLEREVGRLNKLYEGIKFMDKLPLLMIVVDSKLEENAIKEANVAGVPVVALMDTNCDPDLVKYVIPANDDSIKSIKLFLEVFSQAIAKGKKSARVISLRRDHEAKLDQLRKEFAQKAELARQQEELERERLKKLRSGELKPEDIAKETQVFRIVKKAKAVEETVVEEAHKESTKKTVKVALKAKAVKVAPKAGVTKVVKKTTKAKVAKESKKDSVKKPEKKAAKTVRKSVAKESKSAKLEDSGLSARTLKALNEAGIKNLDELKGKTEDELTAIKGVGAASVKEILKAVK